MNSQNTQLVLVAGFSKTATWTLIGFHFGSLYAHRQIETRYESNKVKILWGILQSHKVVDDFIKCGFMSHPTIVAEMGAFTITERVDPAQLGVLREDNKRKEKRILEQLTDRALIQKLEAAFNTFKANAKNEMNELRKKK